MLHLDLGRLVDSRWEGRKAVREAVRSEADLIKICTTGGIGSEVDHPNDVHFTAEEIAARGTALVPTHALAGIFEQTLKDPRDIPPWRLRKQREAILAMRASVREALEAGVLIGAGSDFLGMPGRVHGDNAAEAIALVGVGTSPTQAPVSSTLHNARIIGCEAECGTLEPGKYADLVAFEGNTTVDIQGLESPAFVMRHGEVILSRPPPRLREG